MAKEQQFKKNDPRINLNGRPKGAVSLVTKLREALNKIHEGTGKEYHELLIKSMMKDGIKTDGQSRRLIIQYLEGMPREIKNINVTMPTPILKLGSKETDE